MTHRLFACSAAAAGALILVGACGKSSPSGPTTTTTTTSTGGSNTTITISNNSVSPKTLTVPVGTRVTFFNNDTTNHDMESDPHPDHTGPTACTEINQVNFLTPGQRRETGNLNTARTCTYHDHNQDANQNLRGTIIVQ
jgi:plastocyanin